MDNVGLITILLSGVVILAIISNKYNFPFPIVLVLSGLVISLIPGLPVISLQPDIIFLIFLPPLLYEASWNTNWYNFKAYKRPILLAAFGLVFFTTLIIEIVAHTFINGISWPLGFLLGAIVSPTDAVAATSITKKLEMPPRIVSILEGESLVNDASGLIVYKYAIATVMAGNFVFWQAGLNFFLVIVGGVGIGLIVGFIVFFISKRIIFDSVIQTSITFLIPFTSYLIAEYFEVSGVLAVVSTGLFLSYRSESIFTHQTRITTYAVWDVIVFILNGLIFILIGLQLRSVMNGIRIYSKTELIFYGILTSMVVIICRFIFVVPAALLPRYLSKKIRETEPFDSRNMIVFGWAGMRGVISLAAALSLPLFLPDGHAFPERNLIIYLTFCVILATLVFLGLPLPWVIRKLKIPVHSLVAEEYEVRSVVLTTTIDHLEKNLSKVNDQFREDIKKKYDYKLKRIQKTDLPVDYFGKDKPIVTPDNIFNEYSRLEVDIIGVERRSLINLYRRGKVSEEIVRKIERELDLE
ncbi:MAG: Na+/H+ antiporter, partial [Ginsengibacter sp.]